MLSLLFPSQARKFTLILHFALFTTKSSASLQKLFQQLGEGKDEHSREDIGNSVDYVKVEARGDPGERLLEVKAVKKRLPRGVDDSKCESVERTDGRVDEHRDLLWNFFRYEHSHTPKNGPDI